MFGLAIQVIQRRWLLSISLVLMIVLTLLNTTATLGLISYVSTIHARDVRLNIDKDSYYVTEPIAKSDIEEVNSRANIFGFSAFWQAYGFERTQNRLVEKSFTFLPIKVIAYAPSWRLPLVKGALPKAPRDVLINGYFSSAYGVGIDDVITLAGYDQLSTYRVCGILNDSHYETSQIGQQRIFVYSVSEVEKDGTAFDLKQQNSAGGSLLEAFMQRYDKPLMAEYLSDGYFRSLKLRQLILPLVIALCMWLIQLILIIYIIFVVLKHLVINYPHSMVFQGRWRFDHLDVYLNYFMLLLLLAFLISSFILRPYLMNLTAASELDINQISSVRLMIIHGLGLGFWMNVMVIINAVVQRFFVSLRNHKNLYRSNKLPQPKPYSMLSRIGGIVFVNSMIALLLIISIEVGNWSEALVQNPSLWGFAKDKVALNVNADSREADSSETEVGYTYNPIVIDGASLLYAKGVVSEEGFEPFDIQLISGRLPVYPNEIVVGRGLVDDKEDLGERLRFYDGHGQLRIGVIVGIAHATFDNGRILGYLAPSDKTFIFHEGKGDYAIDYTVSVKRQFGYIFELARGLIIPLISSMVILGIGVLILFYTTATTVVTPYRRLIKILGMGSLRINGFVFIWSLSVGLIAFILANVFWQYLLLPIVNHQSIDFGLEIASLTKVSLERIWSLVLLVIINMTIGFVYFSYEGKLSGNGFLER